MWKLLRSPEPRMDNWLSSDTAPCRPWIKTPGQNRARLLNWFPRVGDFSGTDQGDSARGSFDRFPGLGFAILTVWDDGGWNRSVLYDQGRSWIGSAAWALERGTISPEINSNEIEKPNTGRIYASHGAQDVRTQSSFDEYSGPPTPKRTTAYERDEACTTPELTDDAKIRKLSR